MHVQVLNAKQTQHFPGLFRKQTDSQLADLFKLVFVSASKLSILGVCCGFYPVLLSAFFSLYTSDIHAASLEPSPLVRFWQLD